MGKQIAVAVRLLETVEYVLIIGKIVVYVSKQHVL